MVFEGDAEGKDDTLIVAGIYPDWALIKETLGDKAVMTKRSKNICGHWLTKLMMKIRGTR